MSKSKFASITSCFEGDEEIGDSESPRLTRLESRSDEGTLTIGAIGVGLVALGAAIKSFRDKMKAKRKLPNKVADPAVCSPATLWRACLTGVGRTLWLRNSRLQ